MREPRDQREHDAGWREGGQRTTPLLARPTPLLRDEAMIERTGAGAWLAAADWSGPLAVPVGQRHVSDVIAQRIESIESVPYELLGFADRSFLLHWARKGYPTYAYRAPTGHWNLWLDYWRVTLPLPAHLRLTLPGEYFEDDF